MTYKYAKVPANGKKIQIDNGELIVPERPIIPYIEGDGTGPDIWRAAVRVFEASVEKAYSGSRRIEWMEVYAGKKAFDLTGEWLPEETIDAFREYLVGIKGPLTTPVGGGFRSLNVALRKALDLYVCQRPVRYFEGVPSPVLRPEDVDMVVFRENVEDIYAGVEFELGTEENERFMTWLRESFTAEYQKIRFPNSAAISIKPISREGSERLVRAAIQWALDNDRRSITLAHKGNIMKYTEGAFKDWGYEVVAFRSAALCQECLCPPGHVCSDAILSDVQMPGTSGLDFVAAHKMVECRNTSMALMSGSWSDAELRTARYLGCQIFHKPFKMADLKKWLED